LPPENLLTLVHHRAASRVFDAIIDGPNIPSRARRALLRALEAQFADVIDDRIGARVGARCWAAADPYFKVCPAFLPLAARTLLNSPSQEKLARALLPHAARLAGSPHARFFTRGLGLSLLQRKPEEWRRLHATPSSSATTMSPKSGSNKSTATPTARLTHAREEVGDSVSTSDLPLPARARKKRKRGASATDEIDELFDDAFGRKVTRTALKQQESVQSQSKLETKQTKHGGVGASERMEKDVGLGIVVDAIKAVPRNEGMKKKRRAAS
jgi:nucleolar protein 9